MSVGPSCVCESRSSWRSKTCWGATGSEARRSPASNRDAVPRPTAHLKPRRLRSQGGSEPAGRVSRNAHWWWSHARAGWADSHATPTSAFQWTRRSRTGESFRGKAITPPQVETSLGRQRDRAVRDVAQGKAIVSGGGGGGRVPMGSYERRHVTKVTERCLRRCACRTPGARCRV